MAMNNWGGVKEHMNKRPRAFGKNKRVSRILNRKEEKTRPDFSLAEGKRRAKKRREIVGYLVLLILLVIGFYWFLQG